MLNYLRHGKLVINKDLAEEGELGAEPVECGLATLDRSCEPGHPSGGSPCMLRPGWGLRHPLACSPVSLQACPVQQPPLVSGRGCSVPSPLPFSLELGWPVRTVWQKVLAAVLPGCRVSPHTQLWADLCSLPPSAGW